MKTQVVNIFVFSSAIKYWYSDNTIGLQWPNDITTQHQVAISVRNHDENFKEYEFGNEFKWNVFFNEINQHNTAGKLNSHDPRGHLFESFATDVILEYHNLYHCNESY